MDFLTDFFFFNIETLWSVVLWPNTCSTRWSDFVILLPSFLWHAYESYSQYSHVWWHGTFQSICHILLSLNLFSKASHIRLTIAILNVIHFCQTWRRSNINNWYIVSINILWMNKKGKWKIRKRKRLLNRLCFYSSHVHGWSLTIMEGSSSINVTMKINWQQLHYGNLHYILLLLLRIKIWMRIDDATDIWF